MRAKTLSAFGLLMVLATATGCSENKAPKPGNGREARNDAVVSEVAALNEGDSDAPATPDRSAQSPDRGQLLLNKASLSFSPLKFDMRESEVPSKLKTVDERACREFGECAYIDGNLVEHSFWEGALVLKTLDVELVKGRKIGALGVGLARSRAEVLKAVVKFLDGATPECYAHEEYGSEIACEFSLGEGWTKLFFDRRGQLVYIRLDAYQYT